MQTIIKYPERGDQYVEGYSLSLIEFPSPRLELSTQNLDGDFVNLALTPAQAKRLADSICQHLDTLCSPI
jgi:hypothetical protein